MCMRFVNCLWPEAGRRWTGIRWRMCAAGDWAVRGYKRHLKVVEWFKPSSVNVARAALDCFYTRLGLGRPVVPLEEPIKAINV